MFGSFCRDSDPSYPTYSPEDLIRCLLRKCSHYIRGCARSGNASEAVGESLGSGLGVMYWGAAGEWVGSTKEDNC